MFCHSKLSLPNFCFVLFASSGTGTLIYCFSVVGLMLKDSYRKTAKFHNSFLFLKCRLLGFGPGKVLILSHCVSEHIASCSNGEP